MKLGLGLGLSEHQPSASSFDTPPTAISLLRTSVPEDLAVGLDIGTLSTTDADPGDSFTYSIVSDPSNKFAISGSALTLANPLDFETATSHSVEVRSTDRGGNSVQQAFTISVTDIVEDTHNPDLPAFTGTLVFDGGFTVEPSKNNSGNNLKLQGKNGGTAKFIFDIGAAGAGKKYTMRYDPDFTQLSNTGKEAFVGFGLKKSNNDFHFTGLKGDGGSGLNAYKIYGSALFNASSGFTTVNDGAAAFGTQAGPNWLQIEFAANGSTYTLRTSSNGISWTDEFTAATPSPLTNATDATTFGVGVFLENSDKGTFSIEVQVWEEAQATDPYFASVVLLLSGDGANGGTSFPDDSNAGHVVSVVNGNTTVTGQKKFGTASINCTGANAGMTYVDHADWHISPSNSAEFTVEFWLRIETDTADKMPVGQYSGTDGSWLITLTGTGNIKLQYSFDGSGFSTFASSGAGMTTNTWYHVALSKNASQKLRWHIDGVLRGSTTPANSNWRDANAELSVGSSSGGDAGSRQFDGQIDELRITKGVCRYDTDSNITVPTAAFPRSA